MVALWRLSCSSYFMHVPKYLLVLITLILNANFSATKLCDMTQFINFYRG
ncbi:hypothetical protein CRENPOLYSF1_330004 [Crenothrix polyspora]|uniref:Uncharacterized protein n=1 Tax=Crenothrix polyspora TaxID=360316 RepID=A0A1R4H8Z8_9GAMM|nr:hypothetical protein CRENPOLYSF1_330004 [Crenothrix polyspora]